MEESCWTRGQHRLAGWIFFSVLKRLLKSSVELAGSWRAITGCFNVECSPESGESCALGSHRARTVACLPHRQPYLCQRLRPIICVMAVAKTPRVTGVCLPHQNKWNSFKMRLCCISYTKAFPVLFPVHGAKRILVISLESVNPVRQKTGKCM